MKNWLLSLVSFVCLFVGAPQAQAKPNVLFLLTDDQRADTIGALGNDVIKTPNLDALAKRSFVFNNAYCLGANMGAVCRPSRNMLLSGRVYFRWLGERNASADQPNFPDSMKTAGYETFHIGKKGNTADLIQKRFDHEVYVPDAQVRNSGEHGQREIDDALALLERRDASKPFFMYIAFAGPHDPRVAAEHYLKQYQRDKIPLPKNYLPQHPFDNGWMSGRDEALAPWLRTEEVVRKHLHDYYACITSIDGHIGRMLGKLKASGELDNTLIIFSSDHGLALGSHGLFGKQNLYEDGMKVPLLVAGPGVSPGKSDALVYLHDIFPSTCELIGAKDPANLDGQSFAPLVWGQENAVTRDSLFSAFENSQRAVRNARWKLIRYPQINKSQLFDLAADPHENHDLSDDSAHTERIAKLMEKLQAWQRELGDHQPLTVENPRGANWSPPVTPAAGQRKSKAQKQKRVSARQSRTATE
jgi:arylsulfatase A-like enzyme